MTVGLLDQDQSREKNEFAGLSSENREKYRKFWWKSRILRSVQLPLLLVALAGWSYPVVALKVPRLLAAVFGVTLGVSYVWQQSLHGPPCNAQFDGGFVDGLIPTIPSWKCYARDLSHNEVKYIPKRTS